MTNAAAVLAVEVGAGRRQLSGLEGLEGQGFEVEFAQQAPRPNGKRRLHPLSTRSSLSPAATG